MIDMLRNFQRFMLGAIAYILLIAFGDFFMPHTNLGIPRGPEIVLEFLLIGWMVHKMRIIPLVRIVREDIGLFFRPCPLDRTNHETID